MIVSECLGRTAGEFRHKPEARQEASRGWFLGGRVTKRGLDRPGLKCQCQVLWEIIAFYEPRWLDQRQMLGEVSLHGPEGHCE